MAQILAEAQEAELSKCSRCGAPLPFDVLTLSPSGRAIETGKLQTIQVSEYIRKLMPRELPDALDDEDNAIKRRKIIIFGGEESGKSNDAQVIIDELKRTFGAKNVGVIWFNAENFRVVVESKWPSKRIMVIVFGDSTAANMTDADAKDYFRMRHIMAERTGHYDGLCVSIFEVHSFYDMPRSFRKDYDSLIVLSLPMDDWDFKFIESKITPDGVQVLEQAEADETHGQAIVSVRRHLLAVTQFPRRQPKRAGPVSFLSRLPHLIGNRNPQPPKEATPKPEPQKAAKRRFCPRCGEPVGETGECGRC